MTPPEPDPGRDDVTGFMLRSYADSGHLSFTAPPADVIVRRARRRTTTKVMLSFAAVVAVAAGGIAAITGLGPDPDRDPPIIGPTPTPSVSLFPTPSPPPTPATTPPSTPPDPSGRSRPASPDNTPSGTGSAPTGENAPPSGGGVFSGTREVALWMEAGPPGYLVVAADGEVIGNIRLTERSVFVPVPVGDRHQLRTAFADNSCVGVRSNASGPSTLVVAVCAPEAQGQLFRFVETDDRDSEGRRTYRIESTSGVVAFSTRDGVHVNDGDYDVTGFAVIDQGPA